MTHRISGKGFLASERTGESIGGARGYRFDLRPTYTRLPDGDRLEGLPELFGSIEVLGATDRAQLERDERYVLALADGRSLTFYISLYGDTEARIIAVSGL